MKDKNYFAFFIGYNLLNDEFKNAPNPRGGNIFEFCQIIADDFINSDYYKAAEMPNYKTLELFIKENKIDILKKYEKHIGIKNLFFDDNKKVLEFGKRNDEPVALIEWKRGDTKEYVIAIDYIIKGKDISWGSGFYFNSYENARIEFNKVKNGQYMTFNTKSRDMER